AESGLTLSMIAWAEDFYELLAAEMVSIVTGFTATLDLLEWNETEGIWEVTSNIGSGNGSVTLTNASDALPPQSCPTLIGVTGRPKSRGRKSIPFLGEDTQDQGSWETAALAALVTAGLEYVTTHIVETGKAAIPGVASTVTGTFLPFLAGSLTGYVFSQIRRTMGRGA
ncbi:MAG: hypothetical protein GTO14_05765, partial [Anaerolineales bacterium]|nr:hypothetical protein [Anaerolineales bacterium]